MPLRLPIPRGARVLDIGSGGRPHARATVLADRFLEDSGHREGRGLTRDRRPLVLAAGESLPFRDGAFDYCICCHVLEHADDPARFLTEMQRVAKAGFIETPSALHEWMFGIPPYDTVHKWLIDRDGSTLVLAPKASDTSRHPFQHLLDNLRLSDPYFIRWMETAPQLLTVQHFWSGTIDYRISETTSALPLDSPEAVESYLARLARAEDFYWGSGFWGFKRWLYARAVHPAFRHWGKRLMGRVRKHP